MSELLYTGLSVYLLEIHTSSVQNVNLNVHKFYLFVGGVVASWLVGSTVEWAVRVRGQGHCVVFFFTPSTTDTHNTCAERGRAQSGYHILKKFKAFLASSFVRGVLRSTTASVYKLFIRRFSRIQVS